MNARRVLLAPVRWLLAAVRWLCEVPSDAPPAPYSWPLVLEIEAGYPNGATGAILERATLAELERDGTHRVTLPPGADHLAVRAVRRAGLYAGSTTTVERESEPPPAFLTGGR